MITDYFDIEEVVCPHVLDYYRAWEPLNSYGHFAWNFFDIRLLVTVEILHLALNKHMYVNDYTVYGVFSQRGFRCVKCQEMVDLYKSGKLFTDPHALGKAWDLTVAGMTAEEVRQWITANQKILPYPIRLEDKVTWVHLDTLNNSSQKVVLFNT
jgi:hypothetical protein